MSTRIGQRIARKACDFCRERKIKCSNDDPSLPCDGCIELSVPCTFSNTQKRRGRPHRTLARFLAAREPLHASNENISFSTPKSAGSVGTNSSTHEVLPHCLPIVSLISSITIEHLCPIPVFYRIISDYLTFIYPITPIPHRPTFNSALSSRLYDHDPEFLRLCLSICAMTVSSLQRRMPSYGFGYYNHAGGMVQRVDQLITASRLATNELDPSSSNTMICSFLLGMASHYVGKPMRGWVLINESIQVSRSLNLAAKEGYDGRDLVDTEMCKRAFWMLYIIQIHDRLSHITPYTLLGQDPSLTDWEFLIPLELDDDDLVLSKGQSRKGEPTLTPLIAGFIALVKVFLCVLNLITDESKNQLPNSPSVSQLGVEPVPTLNNTGLGRQVTNHVNKQSIMSNLSNIINDLPPSLRDLSPPQHSHNESETTYTRQFQIMKANIHITRLYLQSSILESFTSSPAPTSSSSLDPGTPSKGANQLWQSREDICRQLLEVLNYCPLQTLESNGSSMIVKIREIAATLLDNEDDDGVYISEVAERSKRYVQSFVEILAELDIAAQRVVGMQNSTSPSSVRDS
ncbi:hypothetical protein BGZ60DRAFT_40262 [Tricladium varicosporioides]|nr:hypothetical protein BGZ60DRAFT_40262 [Hymenoscyphus varicosporioides]